MVTDALVATDLALTEDTLEWRRLCRMALIVAARAHKINARREWGIYRDGPNFVVLLRLGEFAC